MLAHIHQADYENVLGTFLSLRLACKNAAQAQDAEEQMWAELDRLSALLHPFDPASELNCWQHGTQPMQLSPELREVLQQAHDLQRLTNGAFHVGVAELSALWDEAATHGSAPSSQQLAEVCLALRQPFWSQSHGPTPPPPYRLNLSAFAKGFIVDAAAKAAFEAGAKSVRLNVGGEIRHLSTQRWGLSRACLVQVCHPQRESQVVTTVRLSNGGFASSGHSKRGRFVGGVWHSHLIDPRTGECVQVTAGASVLAGSCARADAFATALCVLSPPEGLQLCAELELAALIFPPQGAPLASALWPAPSTPPSPSWSLWGPKRSLL